MVEEELEDEMAQEPAVSWADLVEDELEDITWAQEPEYPDAISEADLADTSSEDSSPDDNSIEQPIPLYEQQLQWCYHDWQARQWRNRQNLWWTDPPPIVNDDGRQSPIYAKWGDRQPRPSPLWQSQTTEELRLRDCFSAWQYRKLARDEELYWTRPPPIINDDGRQPPLYVHRDYSRPGPSRLAQVEYPDKPDNANMDTDDTDSGYYTEEETPSLPDLSTPEELTTLVENPVLTVMTDLSTPEELTTSVENPVLTVTTPRVEEYPSFRRYFFVKVANVLTSARAVVDTAAELIR